MVQNPEHCSKDSLFTLRAFFFKIAVVSRLLIIGCGIASLVATLARLTPHRTSRSPCSGKPVNMVLCVLLAFLPQFYLGKKNEHNDELLGPDTTSMGWGSST